MKFFNKEVKIALVAICGLVILFFGMNFLKGLKLFTPENIYYISFKDISGLSSSSAIYADGFKVGVVRNIIYNFNKKGALIPGYVANVAVINKDFSLGGLFINGRLARGQLSKEFINVV